MLVALALLVGGYYLYKHAYGAPVEDPVKQPDAAGHFDDVDPTRHKDVVPKPKYTENKVIVKGAPPAHKYEVWT